jgi:hypothetical protein
MNNSINIETLRQQETFCSDVRTTEDGRKSVFDLLDTQGVKSPREVFKRVKEQYPEVVDICDNLKFPGAGQRVTPVVDRDGWFLILGVLPNIAGVKYRRAAAKVMGQLQDGDADLGATLIIRDHNKARQEKAMKRVKAALSNKNVAELSQRHSQPFYRIHDDRNVGLYGMNTKQLRADGNVDGKETPLNYLSDLDLSYTDAANGMVIKADNPSLMVRAAAGLAKLHEEITGEKLQPTWDDDRLTPAKARKITHSSNYQVEMPV